MTGNGREDGGRDQVWVEFAGLGVTGDALFVLGTGFLGGYTTFSTWMLEAQRLGEDAEIGLLLAYLLGSMLLGLAATGAGWALAGWMR